MASSKSSIVIAADPWCPYNCGEQDAKLGYMIDIARQVYATTDYQVEYVNMPWSRAIKSVIAGEVDALVGVTRNEVKELIFPQQPLGIATQTFYTLTTSDWQYQGFSSLENIILGVIQGYAYGDLYQSYVAHNLNDASKIYVATSIAGMAQNIRMLRKGRIDVLIEDKNVIEHYFNHNKRPFNLRSAEVLCDEALYIAFSPKREDAQTLADLMTTNLNQLRHSGVLQIILQGYGLQDWDTKAIKPCN
ncbi:MAG: substrate-binding periplasmic protein [Aestuariibacter sp.]